MKHSLLIVLLFCCGTALAEDPPVTVNFYAWGGDPEVNRYLRWASAELRQQAIELRHVKVADIAEVVKQITDGRSNADLVWINGENFHALKAADALLPLQDVVATETLIRRDIHWQMDFGEAVDDLEMPWGVGQFYLLTCQNCLPKGSLSPAQLLDYAKSNPGRLSYPKPPEFHGSTFLKMLALNLSQQPEHFQQPTAAVDAAATLAPLWAYLDQLHPYLWQQGQAFPTSAAEQLALFANAQLHMAVNFNPNAVVTLVEQGRVPASTQAAWVGDAVITNSHYLAIPVTTTQVEAAKQVIRFLLSKSAQQKKADPKGWGDPAVIAPVASQALMPAVPDFHVSWQQLLEQEWSARYQ